MPIFKGERMLYNTMENNGIEEDKWNGNDK
jgi:hypothetical protein